MTEPKYTIRAITLWEPWATLVALGVKRIETRSWAPSYRGPLAIHAAKRWRKDDQEVYFRQEPFYSVLAVAGYSEPSQLPFGCVVAIVDLTNCWRTEIAEPRLAAAGKDLELAFGNYAPGRWGWYLDNLRRLERPIPARGAQGIWFWEVPGDLVEGLGL